MGVIFCQKGDSYHAPVVVVVMNKYIQVSTRKQYYWVIQFQQLSKLWLVLICCSIGAVRSKSINFHLHPSTLIQQYP